jgi:uncharacterized iron-regulated protein
MGRGGAAIRGGKMTGGRNPGLLLCAAIATAGCAGNAHGVHDFHALGHPPAAPAAAARPIEATPVLELKKTPALQDIMPALAQQRVVYIGETHDVYAHHLTQLEIIKRLHEVNPRLAIGMEMFQQPFQGYLDDYIAGRLSERQMLVATEYFKRWRYDYRYYAPILRYARDHQLPVIALNVPTDLVEQVRAHGIAGLTAADSVRLPAIDRGDAKYEARLRELFAQHPHTRGHGFDRFLDGQLLWDEGMADRAARYLIEHPERSLVVLTGSGHLAYGGGIPQRLERRLPVTGAIVLNGWEGEITPEVADYLLMPEAQPLPAAGRIGALLVPDKQGLKVESCVQDSACAAAGLERGDHLLAIDSVPVSDLADVNTVMWDKRPDETATLSIRRGHWYAPAEQRDYTLRLQ